MQNDWWIIKGEIFRIHLYTNRTSMSRLFSLVVNNALKLFGIQMNYWIMVNFSIDSWTFIQQIANTNTALIRICRYWKWIQIQLWSTWWGKKKALYCWCRLTLSFHFICYDITSLRRTSFNYAIDVDISFFCFVHWKKKT